MKKLINYLKSHSKEIIRFVVVGLTATLADYLTSLLFLKVIYTDQTPIFGGDSLSRSLVLAKTMGYVVGIIVNYILSTFFVFKNVEDKKKSRSVLGFVIFSLLSIGGFLINLGITKLGNLIYSVDNNIWWYTFVFIVATGVVLIYNYITRKYILYREPKEENETEQF